MDMLFRQFRCARGEFKMVLNFSIAVHNNKQNLSTTCTALAVIPIGIISSCGVMGREIESRWG
jgi:hypothetical protein